MKMGKDSRYSIKLPNCMVVDVIAKDSVKALQIVSEVYDIPYMKLELIHG